MQKGHLFVSGTKQFLCLFTSLCHKQKRIRTFMKSFYFFIIKIQHWHESGFMSGNFRCASCSQPMFAEWHLSKFENRNILWFSTHWFDHTWLKLIDSKAILTPFFFTQFILPCDSRLNNWYACLGICFIDNFVSRSQNLIFYITADHDYKSLKFSMYHI